MIRQGDQGSKEIHEMVDGISPESAKKVGQSISMHTGINTGLWLPVKWTWRKGPMGLAGQYHQCGFSASSLAKPGEILVGPATYPQAEGYSSIFRPEDNHPQRESRPCPRLQSDIAQGETRHDHRLSGLRADLTSAGRPK